MNFDAVDLVIVVIGLIWVYLTCLICVWVIEKAREKEEYDKKHVPPFVPGADIYISTQNGTIKRHRRN